MEASDKSGEAPSRRGAADVFIVLILMGTLVLVLFRLIDEYGTDVEKITGVAGAVVPAIGVIAGAAFGVAVAWPSAKAAGNAVGRRQGSKEVAKELKPLVDDAKASLEQIVEPLQRALSSPSGDTAFRVPADEPMEQLVFEASDLSAARASIWAVARSCDRLTS